MCASYGLEIDPASIEFEGFSEQVRLSDEQLNALAEWVQRHPEPTLPTGVNALNLSPVLRNRGSGTQWDPAWFAMWVRGKPAKLATFNARVEQLLQSNLWSPAVRSRRCIVPASYYIERKQRHELDGGAFGIAAVYSAARFEPPAELTQTQRADFEGWDGWLLSYALVTRPATQNVRGVHERMPLILDPADYQDWLDPARPGDHDLVTQVLSGSEGVSQRVQVLG